MNAESIASTAARPIEALRAFQVSIASARSPLRITGHGSKDFYGEAPTGEPLSTLALNGITAYEPSELFISVPAGTPLADVETALTENRQRLAFEPPRFGARGTVGGMVAAGLSGPARAALGSVRDHLLGAVLINGHGELLSFGGTVMKNVAGFDVSRALAGSMGVLGVITEVTLKVLPLPAATATLRFEFEQSAALMALNRWGGEPLPIEASVPRSTRRAPAWAASGSRTGSPRPSGTACATRATNSSSAPSVPWRVVRGCGGSACPARRPS